MWTKPPYSIQVFEYDMNDVDYFPCIEPVCVVTYKKQMDLNM